MEQDFFVGEVAHGSVAKRLLANNMDPLVLRPFIGEDGRSYVCKIVNGQPKVLLTNTPATLFYDEWKTFDDVILEVRTARLRFYDDIANRCGRLSIKNGMGTTVLAYQDQSDINPATMSMDGMRKGESDRPVRDLKYMPIPIFHKDFDFTLRELEVSRNPGGQPLDTTNLRLATKKVLEEVEMRALGIRDPFTYGGGTLYGATNFPGRITKTLTLPTAPGWVPNTLVTEILNMKALAAAQFHRGPYMLWVSSNWDEYLDADFSAAKGDRSLRERLAIIKDIVAIETADFLTGWQILMIEVGDPSVARVIEAMPLTMLEWGEQGDMLFRFKVMTIKLTQFREDQNGNTGIVHGVAM